jgi:type II secretory pathway component PulF
MKDQIQKDMEFADRIKSALMYPTFIVVIFFGVLLMMLVVVIPKIASVFTRLNANLPLPTQILIAASNVIIGYPIPFTIISVAIIAGLVLLYKKQKRAVLHMLFKLPLISELIKQIDLTRFSRSMFLLLKSGIIITTALELSEQVVLRQDISDSIRFSKEMVLSGRKLSEAFKQRKHIFPGVIVKIIEAGERTGTLENSMEDISSHLDYEVSKTLKTLTTVLEPIMLVVVGVLVGGMMLAIMAPIYNLIGQVGPR